MEQDSNQAEKMRMLANARNEAAAVALEKSGERLTNQTNNISKLRIEFFDRLVLLDGGTISLSLTLVGLLQRVGKPSHWHLCLFFSWFCFLLSLLLALIRNWREPDRLMAAEWASNALIVHEWASSFTQLAASLGISAADTPMQQALEQGPRVAGAQQKKQEDLYKQTKTMGDAALFFMILGYVLLIAFAIVNAATLL